MRNHLSVHRESLRVPKSASLRLSMSMTALSIKSWGMGTADHLFGPLLDLRALWRSIAPCCHPPTDRWAELFWCNHPTFFVSFFQAPRHREPAARERERPTALLPRR